ncbi:MAG: alpha/beta fold hydrolase, partial [Pseudomonadales bacterium]
MSNPLESSAKVLNSKYGSLYCQRWEAQGEARAVVLLVHGMGEHCQRYDVLANTLAKHSISVCAFDLPGHGQSPGIPGFVEHFSDHVDAVLAYREQLSDYCEGLPVFLLGHSMGGLISVLALLRAQEQFKGCVLSGSAIMSPLQPGMLQMLTIRLLS